ncbi:hypothetical protein [Arundinibacter roseus]|uniref:Uncharacterized protein n=1 Tax=Arundinibacter roseus TaxID=2070510 RepID=A0A4V2XAU2_9BACT|nr:hypothetical protein [Arundinibacter roseus]TDB68965.1 hypothetical protein EZE20_01095 [Arundinibacter roseus]
MHSSYIQSGRKIGKRPGALCGLWLILWAFLALPALHAQSVSFSEDPGTFIVEVKKIMEANAVPAYGQAARDLETVWMSSASSAQQTQFVTLMRRLAGKGQKAGPVFYLLLRNFHTALTQEGADVNGLLTMLSKASERYDAKTYLKLLESVQLVLEKKQLYASNYYKLYLTEGNISFRFDEAAAPTPTANSAVAPTTNDGWDDVPADTAAVLIPTSQALPVLTGALLTLSKGQFAMVTASDSVTFGPSEGSVALREGLFAGKGGKFSWASAGDSTMYVDFADYSFGISNPKLSIENVTLHATNRLSKPIAGAFEFRSVKRQAGKPATYPRFVSKKDDAELRNTRQSMTYRGGLSLVGTTMYSTSLTNEPAHVWVTYQKKPAFRLSSKRFVLTDSVITAALASFSLPLGQDSIYHPGVHFYYSDDAGYLRLERADGTSFADLPYADSYHKMNIWAEAMRWNLAQEKVEFYMIVGKKEVPVRLESYDYFRKQRFQGMAEEFGFQPLIMAANYIQTKKVQAFSPYDLANQYRQDAAIMRSALERLSLQGYFEANEKADLYRLTRKGVMYILANTDKSDYDNFQIISQFEANSELANATISMKDTLLTIRGVERFVVSDSLKIMAVPSDKQLVMGRGRDFVLNGQLKSANFRFTGADIKFNYDKFFVNLNQVDSITYVPQEQYAKGKGSEVGGHVKYEKGGTFYLSDPKNKSGRQKGGKSPRLVIPEGMTVFFDQPERGKLKYQREVFFKIPKLDYDSLDQRDVVFTGTFNSGGIVPAFQTTLKSMDDNSLGFEYKVPAEMKLYGGKSSAKFDSPLVMDNSGLRSTGTLSHLSAAIAAEEMLLTTDSLLASGTEASIKEATIGKGYFPKVELKNYSLRWFPKADSMFIVTKGNSFNFYAGTTQLEGGLMLRSVGLFGYGKLKRADSELASREIKFNKEGFVANQSQFSVTSGQQQSFRPILLGKNVNVDFNIAKNMVDLATAASGFGTDSSTLEFPYAAYRTSISKARWNIAKKTIAMQGDVNNSTFTSTAEEQEGLAFNGSAALYEIEKMMLNISGVPFIRTADVKIIPDKGLVSVRRNGEMNPFKNARIEIDTLNSSHRLRDASIQIVSRNRFEGSATYEYITARKDTFDIKMENFELRETGGAVASSRRNKNAPTPPAGTHYYTTARAEVSENDRLLLSPRMQYKGKVHLIAYEPKLQLDGFIRPQLRPRPELSSSWITFKENGTDSTSDGTISIPINKDLKNEVEQPLFAGLHYRSGGGMYLSFLSPKDTERDRDIFVAQGSLRYEEDSKLFRILPPAGADGLINEANAFIFDDQKGVASFAGPLKLTDSELVRAAGLVDVQVDSARFEFNTLLLLDLPALVPVTPEMATKIVQTNLDEQNSEAAEDDASRLTLKLAALIGQKAADEYLTKTAGEYKPLYEASNLLDVPLVISNLALRWSDVHSSYFSMGKIGVSNMGRSDINAQMDGMFELRKTDRGDEFSMYLEVSPDVWYYLDYSQKQLGLVSSEMDFNDQILAKSKNVKTKDMELIQLGFEEKAMFMDRFYDFYQPALKKARLVKAAEKKETKKKPEKKKVEATEGF